MCATVAARRVYSRRHILYTHFFIICFVQLFYSWIHRSKKNYTPKQMRKKEKEKAKSDFIMGQAKKCPVVKVFTGKMLC